MRSLLLALTSCAILNGCATIRTSSADTIDLPILFAAFEHHFGIRHGASGLILPIYLGVDGSDPPIHVLSAFRKRYPTVFFHRYAKRTLNARNEVIDYRSGREAQSIEFSRVKWLSDSEAKVEIAWYCHPTFSGADLYRLRKQGDTWRIVGKNKLYRT